MANPPVRAPNTLLTTKLEIPLLKSHIIRREHLTNLLQTSLERQVTLLVAPTGYGKTTLLTEWLSTHAAAGWQTVWVSLDGSDNLDGHFFDYLLAGLQKVSPHFLEIPRPPCQGQPDEQLAWHNQVINSIASNPHQICLILDDCQAIQNESVFEALAYLVEHQPDNLHLILSSRTRPPIPFTRLRTQGRLLEIQARDLALNHHEANLFLSSVMGLTLDPDQKAELIKTTEGWLAGLHLAGILLQTQQPVPNLKTILPTIQAEITAYLQEEAISRQSGPVLDFLLRTSILDRLSAPLCDAVLQGSSSAERIEEIEKNNLFLLPVENQAGWYRYHPMFAGALQTALMRKLPGEVAQMHQRAYTWLREHGYAGQAVNHAMQIFDQETVAGIIDECAIQALIDWDLAGVANWFKRLPEDLLARRPRLGIYYAIAYSLLGFPDLVEVKLRAVDQIIDRADTPFSEAVRGQVRREVDIIRAVNECRFGNTNRGLPRLRELFEKVSGDEAYLRGYMAHVLAEASIQMGDLENAVEAYRQDYESSHIQGFVLGELQACFGLARARKQQGHLQEAELAFLRCLEIAVQAGMEARTIAVLQMSLVDIALERGECQSLDGRVRSIVGCYDKIEDGSAEWEVQTYLNVYLAKYFLTFENLDSARFYLQRAEDIYQQFHLSGSQIPVEFIEIQTDLWIQLKSLKTCERWLRERITQLNAAGNPAPVEVAAWARCLFSQERFDLGLSAALEAEKVARRAGRGELLVKILILQALILQRKEKQHLAQETIEQAIRLAAPQDARYNFLREGQPMREMLETFLEEHSPVPRDETDLPVVRFVRGILAALTNPLPILNLATPFQSLSIMPPLLKPLSPREQQVYELMAAGKTTKQIATGLIISLNTAKTHVRSICRKLGVHSREDAIQQGK